DTAALRERNQRSARARERCPWHLRSMLCEAIEMMSHSVVPSSFIRVTPLSSVGAFAAQPLVSASACARARTRGSGGVSCRGGSCTRRGWSSRVVSVLPVHRLRDVVEVLGMLIGHRILDHIEASVRAVPVHLVELPLRAGTGLVLR